VTRNHFMKQLTSIRQSIQQGDIDKGIAQLRPLYEAGMSWLNNADVSPADHDDDNASTLAVLTYQDVAEALFDLLLNAIIVNDSEEMSMLLIAFEEFSPKMSLNPRRNAFEGYRLCVLGRRAQGMRCLKTAIEANPNHYESFLLRGMVYYNSGHFERAMADMERADGLSKENIYVMSILADILYELKQFERSELLHRLVLAKCDNFRRSLLSLGMILFESLRHKESFALFNRLLVDEPLNWFAWTCMGDMRAAQRGYTFESVPCYAMALVSGSNEPALRISLAKHLLVLGHYESVRRTLNTSTKDHEHATFGLPGSSPAMRKTPSERAEFAYFELIGDIVTPKDDFDEDKILNKLKALKADHTTESLFMLLIEYVTLDYKARISEVFRKSFLGFLIIDNYLRDCSTRPIKPEETFLLGTIARAAIWSGLLLAANSILNILRQAEDALILDFVDLLEVELFEHNRLSKNADVEVEHLHQEIFRSEQAGPHYLAIVKDPNAELTLDDQWAQTLGAHFGLATSHDWAMVFFNPAYLASLKDFYGDDPSPECRHNVVQIYALFVANYGTLSNPNTPFAPPFDTLIPTLGPKGARLVEDLIRAYGARPGTHCLSWTDFWRCFRQHALAVDVPLRPPERAAYTPDNDNDIDVEALNENSFRSFLPAEKVFFDNSAFTESFPPYTQQVGIVDALFAEDCLRRIGQRVFPACLRGLVQHAIQKPETDAIVEEFNDALVDLWKILRGAAPVNTKIPSVHCPIVLETLKIFLPEPCIAEFLADLVEFGNASTFDGLCLPAQPIPACEALFRIQSPNTISRAADILHTIAPGNYLAFRDLCELFHNYAVFAVENVRHHAVTDDLAAILESDEHFTFETSPKVCGSTKVIKDIKAFVRALKTHAKDAEKSFQPKLVFHFGKGTSDHPFFQQFDAWAHAQAGHILSECAEIEFSLRHAQSAPPFEIFCRINTLINRFPFLSRVYIYLADYYVKTSAPEKAIQAIEDGLVWEDRLYRGTGWLPIHPDSHGEESPFNPIYPAGDHELSVMIWPEWQTVIQQDDFFFHATDLDVGAGMRRRYPDKTPITIQREMFDDKGGIFDFYRLFKRFIQEDGHIRSVFLQCVTIPGPHSLEEVLRRFIARLEDNETFDLHRQCVDLLRQLYPKTPCTALAKFYCDNFQPINALMIASGEYIRHSPESFPQHYARATETLGAALYDMGYMDEACYHLKNATMLSHASASAFLTYGCACIEARDFQAAIQTLQEGLRRDPANDRFGYNLALAYIELGQYDKAEQCLKKSLRHARSASDIGIQLIRVLVKQARFQSAIETARLLSKEDPVGFCTAMTYPEFEDFKKLRIVQDLIAGCSAYL